MTSSWLPKPANPSTGASRRRPAIRITSAATKAARICIGCARSSTRSWSGSRPWLPTIRSSRFAWCTDRVRRASCSIRTRADGDRQAAATALKAGPRKAVNAVVDLLYSPDAKVRAAGIEIVTLPLTDGRFAPAAILGALAERGFRRVLIEGGPATISGFLAASCLDRLHVLVAPIILGAGPAGLALPPIARVDEALRPAVRIHRIAEEVLFDCDLSARRVPIFRAKG